MSHFIDSKKKFIEISCPEKGESVFKSFICAHIYILFYGNKLYIESCYKFLCRTLNRF